MNTIDTKNNSLKETKDSRNQSINERSPLLNEEFYDIDDMKEEDSSSNKENAERGYTVRNGHNPNKPNPDEFTAIEDDLSDDFHAEKDLEDSSDYVYEVELEEDENDEFDNPSDVLEDDFNETEDDLDEIDQEEDDEYIEEDVQEDEEENYPDNDPRKF